MDNTKRLGEEKISRLLLDFSLPAIIGMLVSALYNVIDRVFIGNGAGSLGIAGITIGFPIMILIMAFGMLIGIGATSLVSIRLGEQKKDEAELIMGNAVLLLIIISFVIMLPGLIFLDPVLKLFGASSEVLPYARDYMGIILLGTIFQSLSFGMNSFIRAEGNPRKAMATMLIGAVLNAILAPIFIFGFKWGMKGAALATIISQAVSATWVLSHFLGGKSFLKLHMKNMKLQPGIVEKIVAIGVAPFAMQIAASLLNIILNKSLVQYGGDIAVSGMGAVGSIMALIMMPIFGINQGVQPIIGYNYGARKFDRVKQALKSGVIAASAVTTLGFIMTRVFPAQLISVFNSQDKQLIAFGSYAMGIFLICLPIIGFQVIGTSYFQAVGKPKQAMVLSLSRQVLILIPALLILPHFFKMEGVLVSGPLSDLVSSIITGLWLLAELKNLNRKQQKILDEPDLIPEQ